MSTRISFALCQLPPIKSTRRTPRLRIPAQTPYTSTHSIAIRERKSGTTFGCCCKTPELDCASRWNTAPATVIPKKMMTSNTVCQTGATKLPSRRLEAVTEYSVMGPPIKNAQGPQTHFGLNHYFFQSQSRTEGL